MSHGDRGHKDLNEACNHRASVQRVLCGSLSKCMWALGQGSAKVMVPQKSKLVLQSGSLEG